MITTNHKPLCPSDYEHDLLNNPPPPCACPRPYTITDERPLSWSAISSFEWSAEQWYDTYILGIKQSSPEMTFGSYVDKKLQDDPEYLPHVPRYPHMQHKMRATWHGIPLTGVPDCLDFEQNPKRVLIDYKTGKAPWTQKKADETGQLTMYLLLLYLTEGMRPEEFDCKILWLPTAYQKDFTIGFRNPADPELITFNTQRTMLDILKFGQRIVDTYALMQRYVEQRQRQTV